MNSQTTLQLINNIHTQLELFNKCFYNNIDLGLIQHPELCTFANNMENIITTIKTNLALLQPTTNTINNLDTSNYIDYINCEQLQKLAHTHIN